MNIQISGLDEKLNFIYSYLETSEEKDGKIEGELQALARNVSNLKTQRQSESKNVTPSKSAPTLNVGSKAKKEIKEDRPL